MRPMRIQEHGCIPADHPSLAGHFPGNPVVPGVLLLNHLLSVIEEHWHVEPGAVSWPAVKFMALLRPDEPFVMTMQSVDGQRITFSITRGNTTIASGSLRHHARVVASVES
jgi:3-hydroxyacyl-[acyl-carrier-protein] dehydratase